MIRIGLGRFDAGRVNIAADALRPFRGKLVVNQVTVLFQEVELQVEIVIETVRWHGRTFDGPGRIHFESRAQVVRPADHRDGNLAHQDGSFQLPRLPQRLQGVADFLGGPLTDQDFHRFPVVSDHGIGIPLDRCGGGVVGCFVYHDGQGHLGGFLACQKGRREGQCQQQDGPDC